MRTASLLLASIDKLGRLGEKYKRQLLLRPTINPPLRLDSERFLPLVETEDKGAIDVGKILGDRFEILSRIGEGGMGRVYRAKDCQTGRLVAVKVLFIERVPDARAVARFQQEARAAARLDHPCIAQVYDFGVAASGQSYLVMELFEGRTLAKRIEDEGQLPIDETIKIFVQVCEGLAHAHKNKILHRDLKPSNIMLTTGDDNSPEVKILDFGIAKMRGTVEPSLHITQTGEVLGSPLYMSPEQAKGCHVDQRSDLYSLGCSLYEALTGGPPHIGQSAMSTLLLREIDRPLAMSEASLGRQIPPQLEHIVARLLKRDPDERYQSAFQVKNALLEPLGHEMDGAQPDQEMPAKPRIIKTKITRFQLKLLGVFAALVVLCLGSALWLLDSLEKPKVNSLSGDVLAPLIKPLEIKRPGMLIGALKLEGMAADAQSKKNYAESARLFKQAIQTYVTNLGADNFAEAGDWAELANTYNLMHNEKEELAALENAVRIYSKNSPSYDEHLAGLNYRLAGCYGKQYGKGKQEALKSAIIAYDTAGGLFLKMVPPKAHEAASCYALEGQCLFNARDFERAERPLKIAADLLGKNRRSLEQMLEMQGWLSQCYRTQRKYEQARDVDQQAVDVLRRLEWNPPVKLVHAIFCLAADYHLMSKGTDSSAMNTAVSLNEELLKICDQYPKLLELERIEVLFALGDDYLDLIATQGAAPAKRASECFNELMSRSRSSAKIRDRLQILYEKLGKVEAAQKHFENARHFYRLAMTVSNPNPKAHEQSIFLNELSIAKTYLDEGQVAKAEELYRKQLKFSEKHYGRESYRNASILAALGHTYIHKGKLTEARQYLEMSLAMNEKLQVKHPYEPEDKRFELAKQALGEVNALIEKSTMNKELVGNQKECNKQ